MDKKAELTTQQIVMIIVLLVSFIVLLIFIFKVNFQNTSEKEICQSSVQLSGKTSFFGKIDCKIHYLCISGGGECKGFTYKDTAKISSTKDSDKKNEIMKVLADEMADCWWMFGEGKIDYANWGVVSSTACAVCTQFAFDEKLISNDKLGSISYEEFYNFLKNTKMGDTQKTYAEYMNIDKSKLDASFLGKKIEFGKKYSIYTGRVEAGTITSWIPGGIIKDSSITPTILERDDSSTLKCSSFVTTP
jgi:hypothetical protein